MKKFLYSLIFIWFCLGSTVLAQNPEWINYNTTNSAIPSDSINCIVIDELGNKWIGTWVGGLVKFDDTNPGGAGWTVYNTSNSGLPGNYISSIAIDGSGNKWIVTGEGLVIFDGSNWNIINTSNSGLPDNRVTCIAIDEDGNKWIGTEEGLVKFDGTNWTIYNTSNSGLPENYIGCIAIDKQGNKWIGGGADFIRFDDTTWTVYDIPIPDGYYGMGTIVCITIDNAGSKWIGVDIIEPFSWGGLIRYDGTTFTLYDYSNSGLPGGFIRCIDIDEFDNKWIGIWYGGLAKFDDSNPGWVNWTVYNVSNSGLPSDRIDCIDIDKFGNKWIGTWGGLAVFNEGGIVVPVELTSFTATADGKEVTLNWSTATELNNNGFEVQRKFGNNDFATVGSVKGHGTTASPNQYSYVDMLVDGGRYFYRLKQIDFDGAFDYSKEIEVEVRLLDKFTLEQNYPNPFNPTTRIKYTIPNVILSGAKNLVTLKVYDVLGNEITMLVNEYKPAGSYEVEFDASELSSGVYFYQLKVGSFVETKKMILLR